MTKTILTAIVLAATISSPASTAILQASQANLHTVFAVAKGGDTIQLNGAFGATWLSNRTFTSRLTLDATNAVFNNTLTIDRVTGLNVVSGTFGSTTQAMRVINSVVVVGSTDIDMRSNTFVGNGVIAGADANRGLLVRNSTNVKVWSGSFNNLHTGLGVMSSSNIILDYSQFNTMTSDGINIADSHFVTATGNQCSGTTHFAGAHPDCIQLWSIFGRPVQSDISLIDNIALGNTQGFTSFNASAGGGLRISMIGNYVATTFPQGLACYSCVDSIFRDNIVNTLPGAQWRTAINIIGGNNNVVENNEIGLYGAKVIPIPDRMLKAQHMVNTVAAVPEPSEWLMLIVGFGIAGSLSRRQQKLPTLTTV